MYREHLYECTTYICINNISQTWINIHTCIKPLRHGQIPRGNNFHHRPRQFHIHRFSYCNIPLNEKICHSRCQQCCYLTTKEKNRENAWVCTIWRGLCVQRIQLQPSQWLFHSSSWQNNCWSGRTPHFHKREATWGQKANKNNIKH